MRHLMSPLDLSVDELNTLLTWPVILRNTLINMRMSATTRDLPLYSMSQAPVPASASKLQ